MTGGYFFLSVMRLVGRRRTFARVFVWAEVFLIFIFNRETVHAATSEYVDYVLNVSSDEDLVHDSSFIITIGNISSEYQEYLFDYIKNQEQDHFQRLLKDPDVQNSHGTLSIIIHPQQTIFARNILSITLQNLRGAERPIAHLYRKVTASADSITSCKLLTVTHEGLPLKITIPSWTAAIIGQSIFKQGEVTISGKIQVNFELPPETVVEIFGLTGSITPDGSVSIDSEPSEVFKGGSGRWVKETGHLRLTVASRAGNVWVSGVIVRFNLTNQLVVKSSSDPYTRALTATGATLIPASPMTKDSRGLLGVAGGASPLFVFEPSFTLAMMGQSSPLPSSPNSLSLTLSANVDMSAGCTITISTASGNTAPADRHMTPEPACSKAAGLPGLLVLVNRRDDPISQGEHDRTNCSVTVCTTSRSGSFLMTIVLEKTLAAGLVYTLTTEIMNPPIPQQSPVLTVSVTGPLHIKPREVNKSRSDAAGVEGAAAPLYIMKPEWLLAEIGQSSFLPGANNTISVTLQANFELPIESFVELCGLFGSLTVDGMLAVISVPTGVVSGNFGSWVQSEGCLGFKVALTGLANMSLKFNLTNPPNPCASSDPFVTAFSGSASRSILINSTMIKKDRALLHGLEGGSEPLFVFRPAFTVATMGQSSPLPSDTNILSLTIAFNVDVGPRSFISLVGLRGASLLSVTEKDNHMKSDSLGHGSRIEVELKNDSEEQHITSGISSMYSFLLRASSILDFQKTQEPTEPVSDPRVSDDELRLSIQPRGVMSAGVKYTIELKIINPPKPQIAPTIRISIGGDLDIESQDVNKSNATLMGVIGGREPLLIIDPGWNQNFINQTSFIPGDSNTMCIILQSNFELPPETVVEIFGLTGSITPDGSVSIDSEPSEVFKGGSGRWVKETGHLRLTVASRAGNVWVSGVIVRFNLTNQLVVKSSSDPYTRALTATGATLIPASPMTKDSRGLLGVAGGASPLFVFEPSFTLAMMGQSSPLPSSPNSLSLTLSANVDMSAGCTITISTASGNTAPADRHMTPEPACSKAAGLPGLLVLVNRRDDPISQGEHDRTNCSVTVCTTSRSGSFLMTIVLEKTLAAGLVYTLTTEIMNPPIPQQSPVLTVSVTGPLHIKPREVNKSRSDAAGVEGAAAPLYIMKPEWLLAEIGQSSFLPGAINTISVTLQANFELPVSAVLEIGGLVGAVLQDGIVRVETSLNLSSGDIFGAWKGSDFSIKVFTRVKSDSVKPWISGFVLSFNISNPDLAQAPVDPRISAFTDSGRELIPATVMTKSRLEIDGFPGGSAPLAVFHSTFTFVALGQTWPLTSGENTLIVTLSVSIGFEHGFELSLIVVNDSCTEPDTSLRYFSVLNRVDHAEIIGSSEVVQIPYTITSRLPDKRCVDHEIGSYSIISKKGLSARNQYKFKIHLRNPSRPQKSPGFRLSIRDPASKMWIVSSEIKKSTSSAAGIPGGSAPLFIIEPTWIRAELTREYFLLKETIAFSVNLKANFELPSGAVLELADLPGRAIGDGRVMVHTTPSGIFEGDTGIFALGNLKVTVDERSTNPFWMSDIGVVLQFNLTIMNFTIPSSKPSLTVWSTKDSSFRLMAEHPIIETNNFVFSLLCIGQSTPLPSSANVLSLTLMLNVDISVGDEIRIFGLGSIKLFGEPLLTEINGPNSKNYVDKRRNESGTHLLEARVISGALVNSKDAAENLHSADVLVLVVRPNGRLFSGQTYEILLHVINPEIPQPSPQILVAIQGTVAVSATPAQKSTADAAGVAGGAAPLLIIEPRWHRADIAQSSFLPGVLNTISLTMQANFELPAGSVVEIRGLKGSETADGTFQVDTKPASVFQGDRADWLQFGGVLRLTVTDSAYKISERVWSAQAGVVLHFNLSNPSVERHPQSPTLKSMHFDGSVLIHETKLTCTGDLMLGVLGASMPLRVLMPRFSILVMGQISPLPSAANTLSLSLALNVDLSLGDEIRIFGLSSARLSGEPVLTTENSDSIKVSTSGDSAKSEYTNTFFDVRRVPEADVGARIDQDTTKGADMLVLIIRQNRKLLSGQTYEILLHVINPEIPQPSPQILVAIQGTVAVSATPAQKSTADAAGVAGGAAPLLIIEPRWHRADIAQSSFLPGVLNTISLTMQANFELPAGSVVEIRGLKGSETADGILIVETRPAAVFLGVSGIWTRKNGRLRMTVSTCSMRSTRKVWTAIDGVVLSFNLTNPQTEQHAAEVVIVAIAPAPGGGGQDPEQILASVNSIAPTTRALGFDSRGSAPLLIMKPSLNIYLDSNPAFDISRSLSENETSTQSLEKSTMTLSDAGAITVALRLNFDIGTGFFIKMSEMGRRKLMSASLRGPVAQDDQKIENTTLFNDSRVADTMQKSLESSLPQKQMVLAYARGGNRSHIKACENGTSDAAVSLSCSSCGGGHLSRGIVFTLCKRQEIIAGSELLLVLSRGCRTFRGNLTVTVIGPGLKGRAALKRNISLHPRSPPTSSRSGTSPDQLKKPKQESNFVRTPFWNPINNSQSKSNTNKPTEGNGTLQGENAADYKRDLKNPETTGSESVPKLQGPAGSLLTALRTAIGWTACAIIVTGLLFSLAVYQLKPFFSRKVSTEGPSKARSRTEHASTAATASQVGTGQGHPVEDSDMGYAFTSSGMLLLDPSAVRQARIQALRQELKTRADAENLEKWSIDAGTAAALWLAGQKAAFAAAQAAAAMAAAQATAAAAAAGPAGGNVVRRMQELQA